MKSNFKQHAVRLGGWVRPHHARACFVVVVITSVVYNRALQAQTDNPPTLPVSEAIQTNNPPASLPPATVETNNPTVVSAPMSSANATNVSNATKLPEVTVYGKLDQARSQIMPDLGATEIGRAHV